MRETRELERRTGLVGADAFAKHEVGVFGGLERFDAGVEPPAAHVVPEARVHRGYAVSHRVLSYSLHTEALEQHRVCPRVFS